MNVENDSVRTMCADHVQALRGGGSAKNAVGRLAKILPERVKDGRLVVDDQKRRHGVSSGQSRKRERRFLSPVAHASGSDQFSGGQAEGEASAALRPVHGVEPAAV